MIRKETLRDGTVEATITLPLPDGGEYRMILSGTGTKADALAAIDREIAYDAEKLAFYEERVTGGKAVREYVERAWAARW